MAMKKVVTVLIIMCCLAVSGRVLAEELKIGYVNMRKVFYEYKKTKDFNQKLEKEDEKVREEVEKRTQAIRKLRDEIDLLSEEAKAKRQPELRQKIKDLDDYRKEKIDEFIRKKDEMFKEIRDDIMEKASDYAKKNGYELIFDEAMFVYASNKYDLTDQLLDILNK